MNAEERKRYGYVVLPMLGLVVLSLLLGVWREWMPPTILPGDSNSYLHYNASLLRGETDTFRTPGYPMFIKLTQCFAPKEYALESVVVGQILLFEVSVVLFYLAARELLRSGVLAFLCAAIYGCRYETCIWCFHIMSECLAQFSVILFFYVMVIYVKRPSVQKSVVIGLLAFLMIMVRPVFIYVIALLFGFWIFRLWLCKNSRGSAAWGLASTVVAVLLTLGYCQLNYRTHRVFTISNVATINKLVQIGMTGLYEKGPDEKINAVFRAVIDEPTKPIAVWHPELLTRFEREFSFAELNVYSNQTLRENRLAFVTDVLKWVKKEASNKHFAILYGLCFIELALILFLWIGFRQVPWLHWGVWGMVYCMVFAVFWGAFADYFRLVMPALGLVLVMVFRYFDMFWQCFCLSREQYVEYMKDGL